jgi:hypoxanthine-guanine phosphoribosyltransferase
MLHILQQSQLSQQLDRIREGAAVFKLLKGCLIFFLDLMNGEWTMMIMMMTTMMMTVKHYSDRMDRHMIALAAPPYPMRRRIRYCIL